jgi:anti-sigma-K factor RskA
MTKNVNIQEYIVSGIIESYVLGMASEKEKAEFERLCEKHPELKEARIHFELALEEKAFANAVQPPAFLKTRILEALLRENDDATTAHIISMNNKKTPVRKLAFMRWAVAASVILVLGSGVFLYILYNRNQELKSAVANSQKKTDTLDQQAKKIEEYMLPSENNIEQVKVVTPVQTIPPTINVFGDSTSNDIYIIIKDLITLPAGQQYHLWSVTKGTHTSLGLFDAPADNDKLILKMNNVKDADSFAITIEKR